MVLQLSLSPMTMRERRLCHAHPTESELESSSKRRLTTMILQLSLFPMTMRERLHCHSHPTGPDLESSSKGRYTTMILPLSLSPMQMRERLFCHSPHRVRPGDLVSKPLLPFSFRRLCFTMVTLGG